MTARKKTATKKVAKKSARKKSATTKSTAKKSVAKKSTAKKTSTKKSPAKKSPARKTFAKGDHVAWTTPQGETHGVVEKKLTKPMSIKQHRVAASPENPEYLVRSDKSGDTAAHKPGSLRKKG